MKTTLAFIATGSIMIGSTSVARADINGEKLLEYCSVSEDKPSFGAPFCFGYLDAAASVSHCPKDIGGFSWQAPPGASRAQMKLIVVKFLKDNPDILHYGGVGLVAAALSEAWPCKK